MVLKIFKGVWFISVLVVLANLLYVYALLPEEVVVQEDGISSLRIGREPLFYAAMALVVIINLFVFLFSKTFTPREDVRIWIHGLVISMNLFLIASFSFIGVYNSTETFIYSRGGLVIYISMGLVAAWIISWPLYLVYRKFISKPAVSGDIND